RSVQPCFPKATIPRVSAGLVSQVLLISADYTTVAKTAQLPDERMLGLFLAQTICKWLQSEPVHHDALWNPSWNRMPDHPEDWLLAYTEQLHRLYPALPHSMRCKR